MAVCVVCEIVESYSDVQLVILYSHILFRLAGQGPFWHRKDTIMYRKIMEGKYSFDNPEWEDISDLPKDLVSKHAY